MQWAVALGDKIKGVAVTGVCHEPGCNTLFNMASPSFKLRYMFMADYDDEAEFDAFAETLDLRPLVADIKCPVLIIAGEEDQLSPLQCSYDLFDRITTQKEILVYEGSNHSVTDGLSIALGENPRVYSADWVLDRMNGIAAASVKSWISSQGVRSETPV